MKAMNIRILLTLALPSVLAACPSNKDSGDTASEASWESDADVDADAPDDEADTGDDYVPEEEQDFLMLRPASTDIFVFVANPSRDTVTRIEVGSLDVATTLVGSSPDLVVTSGDYATALTLNSGSDDVSIIDADTLGVRNVGVRPNLNALSLSPDGRWAVAYHDADVPDEEGSSSGSRVESYNEISIIDTVEGRSYEAVVGLNPKDVVFSELGDLALVVSDESLTSLDLSGKEPMTEMVYLSEDLVDPPPAEETLISPSGEYAFVRQFGTDSVLVVDLMDLVTTIIPVGVNPTDMDISPDGSMAVVVTRTDSKLWVFDTLDPYATPTELSWVGTITSNPVIGSLTFTPDGGNALLYTNATAQDLYLTWDLESGQFAEHRLIKPIQTLTVSPDGQSVLIFHTLADSATADPDTAWYGRWALTLVDLQDYRSNPLVLAAEPTAYAHSADGHFGFFIMESLPWLEVLDYDTLMCDSIELGSLPLFVGALPFSPVSYVSQDHELGRISFYDTSDKSFQTMTGFELNAGIES